MAKLAFSKLGLKKLDKTISLPIGENVIEVKQYLSMEEKIKTIQNIVSSTDLNSVQHFPNPIIFSTCAYLEIIFAYTNLSFTDKQKEDAVKLYDLMAENGIIDKVLEVIPDEEINYILDNAQEILDGMHTFRNSALGLVDTIVNNYETANADAKELETTLSNPENLKLLRDVLTKIG